MTISTPSATRLAIGLCILAMAITLVLIALGIVLELDASYGTVWDPGTVFDLLMSLVFTSVGGLLAIKRASNLVGWAMLLSGLGLLVGGLLGVYGELALLAKPEAGLPAGVVAATISSGSWTVLMAGVFLLLLLFPSGRVPSARWRPVATLVLLGFVLIWFGISTVPGHLEPPFEEYENTLTFTDTESYFVVIYPVIAFCLLSIAAAAIDLFFRFRRSKGEEREQFKWLAFAASILAGSIPFSGFEAFGIISTIAPLTFAVGLIGMPLAVGVAVLRYRLYDIDRIINRALVYTLLTAVLALFYFGFVVGLQTLLRPVSGGSDFAIVATTLVVAALFLPARRRLQDAVDRRFNRRAYDAARTIDAFSARLRQQIDLDTLRYELLSVANETMQPARSSLWLRNRNDPGTP